MGRSFSVSAATSQGRKGKAFRALDTQSVTVDLGAGNYALICNIWDEEEQEAHYAMGMRTAFTVE